MRILFAKPLDEHRTAIVLEDTWHGRLYGGVILITGLELGFGTYGSDNFYRSFGGGQGKLTFNWEWFREVQDAESFRAEQNERWDAPKQLAAPMKAIGCG